MTFREIKDKIRNGEITKKEFLEHMMGFVKELDEVIADGTKSLVNTRRDIKVK